MHYFSMVVYLTINETSAFINFVLFFSHDSVAKPNCIIAVAEQIVII